MPIKDTTCMVVYYKKLKNKIKNTARKNMFNSKKILLKINQVTKSFPKPDGKDLLVINHVDLTMHEGEIVALLGRSGSGKSTLLRMMGGLTSPTSGEILYRDIPIKKPMHGISMVFQNFALMPWLTVLENVELGLEALKISAKVRRERALRAIDMIGMDGFESAYPKELSGGMKQRVGFARALVIQPDLLLMDEPFSALDVLTSESLRSDLLELWQDKDSPIKGIFYVTHNIEEAVLTADRVLIFGANPGHIRGELKVNLKHPRNSQDPQVLKLIDDVYMMMTTTAQASQKSAHPHHPVSIGIEYRLPDTGIAELIGLLEELDQLQQKGPVDLPELADVVRLDIDDLFPVLESLNLLGLAKISKGDISMTNMGKSWIDSDITDKKILFAQLLIQHIPLAKHISEHLNQEHHKREHYDYFLGELESHFTQSEAERVLNTMIDWARYAEIFNYDAKTGFLSLEDVD